MRIVRCLSLGATLGSSGLLGSVVPALAQMPQPWQLNLQHAATPVMERLYDFHTFLLWIISAIALFVFGLLLFVIVRFRENISPVPSRATHHTLVEVLWTVVPVLILVVIAIPSFRILYYSDWIEEADMTIKAIGHQWYWSYEYPDNGNFTFDAVLTPENELKPGQIRLLETDKRLVLPVDTTIRVLVTADDVIHLVGAVLRREARRHPRPHQRDLDPHRARRHLLWPVRTAVRPGSRFYADHGRGRVQGRFQDVGSGSASEVRPGSR
jgi:cytochrome c oxidase subunit 2